jgi:hypothetical protein
MFWFKRRRKKLKSIDDEFLDRLDRTRLQIQRAHLKERVRRACQDHTNYEQQLKDFCENNRNNLWLLVRVRGYRQYLINCGCTPQQAAKETLEHLR